MALDNPMQNMHLVPTSIGRQDAPERWGPGARDRYILHYVYAGRGFLEVEGRVYPVNAEQSFLIFPNTSILYYPDSENPWSYIWIDFYGDEAGLLIRQTAFSINSPVSAAFPQEEIIPLFMAVHNSFGLDISQQYRSGGYLYVLLAYYVQYFPVNKSPKQSPAYLQNAIHYIMANIYRPITVQDVADYLNISRAHLYRIFEAQLSMSPSEYLIHYRIKSACSLLAGSSLSIKEIAFSLGFDNPLYFTKVFHQIMGIPPSQYRKTMELSK